MDPPTPMLRELNIRSARHALSVSLSVLQKQCVPFFLAALHVLVPIYILKLPLYLYVATFTDKSSALIHNSSPSLLKLPSSSYAAVLDSKVSAFPFGLSLLKGINGNSFIPLWSSDTFDSTPPTAPPSPPPPALVISSLILLILSSLTAYLYIPIVVKAVAVEYIGEQAEARQLLKATKRRWLHVAITSIIICAVQVFFLVSVGITTLLLINTFPQQAVLITPLAAIMVVAVLFFLNVSWCFAFVIASFERLYGFAALSKSYLMQVAPATYMAFAIITVFPFMAAGGAIQAALQGGVTSTTMWVMLLASGFEMIAKDVLGLFFLSVYFAGVTALYFSARNKCDNQNIPGSFHQGVIAAYAHDSDGPMSGYAPVAVA